MTLLRATLVALLALVAVGWASPALANADSPLIDAVRVDDVDAVRVLIDQGADVDVRTSFVLTLHSG